MENFKIKFRNYICIKSWESCRGDLSYMELEEIIFLRGENKRDVLEDIVDREDKMNRGFWYDLDSWVGIDNKKDLMEKINDKESGWVEEGENGNLIISLYEGSSWLIVDEDFELSKDNVSKELNKIVEYCYK